MRDSDTTIVFLMIISYSGDIHGFYIISIYHPVERKSIFNCILRHLCMYNSPGYLHGIYLPEYLSYIGHHNESKSAEKQIVNLVETLFGFWIEVNTKLIYSQAHY
jgi:hypothetical protein